MLSALLVFKVQGIEKPSGWAKLANKKKQNWIRKHERRLEKEAKREPGARCSLVYGAMTSFVVSDEADLGSPCFSVISGLFLIILLSVSSNFSRAAQAPLLPFITTTQATSTLMLLLCGLFLVSLRQDTMPFFLTAHRSERSVCKLERQTAPAKRHRVTAVPPTIATTRWHCTNAWNHCRCVSSH